ncbi:flagellar protein FlaG [Fervidicoccus fontis]|uniref:Archaeal flagellar protein FlaG n=1 Tax=Fervidicoccus fontis (strain DSM 19380 / JCM 18336 / VKM B-2539 / Kam940) TaxID=1163730 RepID=I0A1Q7_FERFK|nr:flagellar protein FlaG [Fervidicoccus fontis]AFH42914.1 archaeal flagellar protein FlaG [Fervidicoccus fontis Kam940]
MGESTTITHALLTIAAITIASIFAFVMISKISAINSSITQMISSNVNNMESSITIIDFFYNSSGGSFVIYVKNVGTSDISLSALQNTDVYIGTYNSPLTLYTYLSSAYPGHWNYTLAIGGSNSWSAGSTIIIYLYNQTSISPPYYVKIVLPIGIGSELVEGG